MKVVVNDRESGPLTRAQWKEARTLFPGHPASGRVMNLDEACREQRRVGVIIGTGLLSGCWILALIYAFVGSADGAFAMFIGGVLIWPVTYLGVALSVAARRKGLAQRYRGHSEPGVLVQADER